tara:strand:- start:3621 stop:3923 length:303 start_codon:yes stop_codon:yes gene_type:complete
MQKSQLMDYAWKGFTVLLSIIIVPCFIWIWDSEMRLGALEFKMDDANKNLEKIVNHMESENGQSAVDREVQMKLMEQRLADMEKKCDNMKREINRLKNRR